jgi:hypothetical protein
MTTPTVTETFVALEPVTRDDFADPPPSAAVRDGARQAPTDAGALISRLRILPVGPFGSSSTSHTWRGYL